MAEQQAFSPNSAATMGKAVKGLLLKQKFCSFTESNISLYLWMHKLRWLKQHIASASYIQAEKLYHLPSLDPLLLLILSIQTNTHTDVYPPLSVQLQSLQTAAVTFM